MTVTTEDGGRTNMFAKGPQIKVVAWAAGIFEGEGSINIIPNRPSCASLQVSMTDLDILERLQDIFGGYIYTKQKQKPHHKQGWTWQMSRKADVYATLEKLLPWFGERRSFRALNVLDHLDRI